MAKGPPFKPPWALTIRTAIMATGRNEHSRIRLALLPMVRHLKSSHCLQNSRKSQELTFGPKVDKATSIASGVIKSASGSVILILFLFA